MGIRWGWGEDRATTGYSAVLYIDVPTGQVSFHATHRGRGPDYPGEWDGVRNQAPTRVCTFVCQALGAAA